MLRKILKAAIFLCASLSLTVATAGPTWQPGEIWDHSAVGGGLLIRFNPAVTAMPDNCAGAIWMFIPETNKTIIAVTLMAIASGNRNVMVYTSGLVSGFCMVTQVDPNN
ncbi:MULTISPECIES: hypothetical protein [unclassified Janthinobacterium]|uniref:hypothetical protein n=1 Tax=unclassified Janthinobacterium TaxID=2610881 RepID=UPI00161EAB52|nr:MULTISPECIES: hypothetical protein [unclassified Janthinobacterium]MBB5368569.1 hypothetical protein [Janthinobacterium sp. K2C7]MBB5381895.1 hypothetical protein [Janthinobacterium sp. K2Li3]MBB5386951.1 hypothetical protein [Janthinobacterium sp. K2E3]